MGKAFAVPSVEAETRAGVYTEFAAKCRKFRELKVALDRLYEANDVKLEKLVCPEIPNELLEPLEMPVHGKKTPDGKGWSKSELERLANQGKWEVFVRTDKAGTMTIKSGFHAVPQATKKRATELLPVRVAYDVAHEKWFAKVHRIENSTSRPMNNMDNALLGVMKHQAAHVGDCSTKSKSPKKPTFLRTIAAPDVGKNLPSNAYSATLRSLPCKPNSVSRS